MGKYEQLKGKKITQMGLGLLGRGVGDAKFFAQNGADLIVTDMKSKNELKESLDQLKEYKNITFHLGEHHLEDFRGRDLIVKGAGVPLRSTYIQEVEKFGTPVTMSTALAVKLSQAVCIGITGSKGKSTVTSLIYQALKHKGLRVHLGGNTRGVSTLGLLEDISPGDFLVLELDSWQLQGFEYEKISPQISVFTNFMPDHMNYYHGDMEQYARDKANIFRFHQSGDHLFTTDQVLKELAKYGVKPEGEVVTGTREFPPRVTQLPGKHNMENILLAFMVLRHIGLTREEMTDAWDDYEVLEGRLELVGEYKSVRFYNDSNATIPEATIAALRALSEKGKTHLICGGAYKEVDPRPLAEYINEHDVDTYLLAGTGTEILKEMLDNKYPEYDNLLDAVRDAYEHSMGDDSVLLSPAFASFGMFKNEYDRGDQFKRLVGKVKG